MKCPNPTCHSSRVTAINTYHYDSKGIITELRGLNVTRRRKRCDVCKEIFYTVESIESDFLHLRRKTGRLEVSQASLRPGITK